MRRAHNIPVLLLAGAFTAGGVTAHDDHGPRHQGPHVHGVARLELVIDAQEVHLGLDSPATNLVGFEHAPRSPSERDALDRALSTLRDGDALFRFSPAAECQMVEVAISTPVVHEEGEGEAAQAHPGHDEEAGEAHADIRVAYRFVCRRPERLTELEVVLFPAFPLTERIRVELVTAQGQSLTDLSPRSPMVDLRP